MCVYAVTVTIFSLFYLINGFCFELMTLNCFSFLNPYRSRFRTGVKSRSAEKPPAVVAPSLYLQEPICPFYEIPNNLSQDRKVRMVIIMLT